MKIILSHIVYEILSNVNGELTKSDVLVAIGKIGKGSIKGEYDFVKYKLLLKGINLWDKAVTRTGDQRS